MGMARDEEEKLGHLAKGEEDFGREAGDFQKSIREKYQSRGKGALVSL
jgi:hypothetical protein